MTESKVVAIDGPAGSGKSTVAKRLAKELGLLYLDTGALFRSMALYLEENNCDSEEQFTSLVENLDFRYAPKLDVLVEINGVDYTDKIREHHVSALASHYSQKNYLRNYIQKLERSIVSKGQKTAILEGRDIGTVVFPNAGLKVFLVASAEQRARRRWNQLKESGQEVDYKSLLVDIEMRDKQDSEREYAPLKKAFDALELETTSLTVDEVVQKITKWIKERNL